MSSSKAPSVQSNRSAAGEPSERAPLLGSLEGRLYSGEALAPPGTPVATATPRTLARATSTTAITTTTVITVPTPKEEVRPISPKKKWATIVALAALCSAILAVLCVGFFVPAAAEQYAQEAVALDVSSLSVESFTEHGVKVRVKANVDVDARRVKNWAVRNLGKACTAIFGSVRVHEFDLKAHLPDYNGALLGTAKVPGMTIDIQNGHTTILNFVADTQPGPLETIRLLADDYLSGSLKAIKVLAKVDLKIKKGFLSLTPGTILQEFVLRGLGI
jgi:hypothetical protein